MDILENQHQKLKEKLDNPGIEEERKLFNFWKDNFSEEVAKQKAEKRKKEGGF